jgi:hypothetical protein
VGKVNTPQPIFKKMSEQQTLFRGQSALLFQLAVLHLLVQLKASEIGANKIAFVTQIFTIISICGHWDG